MVLSTIRECGRSIFYLLSNTRYAKKCCFSVAVERGRERCGSQFSYREEISQDAANGQTSLAIRIEKYGYIRREPREKGKGSRTD